MFRECLISNHKISKTVTLVFYLYRFNRTLTPLAAEGQVGNDVFKQIRYGKRR